MKIIKLIILLLVHTLTVQAQTAIDKGAEVVILDVAAPAPTNATMMGTIKVVDNGFKVDCGYDRTMQEAMDKARKIGGNVVKLTKLKDPNGPGCYSLHANVYYTADLESLKKYDSTEYKIKKLISPDAPYAILYFYRPDGMGAMVSYNIHIDDSVVCRMHNDSKYAVKVYKEGPLNIWTRTEARSELNTNIQFGKAYFIQCTVGMGVVIGQPNMQLVSSRTGLHEYNTTSTYEDKDAPYENY